MQGGGTSSECPAQPSWPSWQLSLSYCQMCCPTLCASSFLDTVCGEWAQLPRPHAQLGWEDEVGPGVSWRSHTTCPGHPDRAGTGRAGLGGLWEDGSLRGAGSRSPASRCSLGPRAHPQLPTLPLLQEPSGPRGAGARVLPTPQPRRPSQDPEHTHFLRWSWGPPSSWE